MYTIIKLWLSSFLMQSDYPDVPNFMEVMFHQKVFFFLATSILEFTGQENNLALSTVIVAKVG